MRPCPFCRSTRYWIETPRPTKSEDEVFGDDQGACWVVCRNCRATGPAAGSVAEAKRLWDVDLESMQRTRR